MSIERQSICVKLDGNRGRFVFSLWDEAESVVTGVFVRELSSRDAFMEACRQQDVFLQHGAARSCFG
jgi:hypothetical protein